MARIRTSPAGSGVGATGGERGFTLLELLVVLIIIALAVTIIPGFVLRDGSAQMLDRTSGAVADGLREARASAIRDNREGLFLIDVENRLFRAGPAAAPVRIADDIEIGLITARQERLGETAGAIRFFADGSSTGGRLSLATDGRRHAIDVDWLTGSISVNRHAD